MLHLTNPHNLYKLGCRSKIAITTFFQIRILSIQIDFIAIFRFERFHTIYAYHFYLVKIFSLVSIDLSSNEFGTSESEGQVN